GLPFSINKNCRTKCREGFDRSQQETFLLVRWKTEPDLPHALSRGASRQPKSRYDSRYEHHYTHLFPFVTHNRLFGRNILTSMRKHLSHLSPQKTQKPLW